MLIKFLSIGGYYSGSSDYCYYDYLQISFQHVSKKFCGSISKYSQRSDQSYLCIRTASKSVTFTFKSSYYYSDRGFSLEYMKRGSFPTVRPECGGIYYDAYNLPTMITTTSTTRITTTSPPPIICVISLFLHGKNIFSQLFQGI